MLHLHSNSFISKSTGVSSNWLILILVSLSSLNAFSYVRLQISTKILLNNFVWIDSFKLPIWCMYQFNGAVHQITKSMIGIYFLNHIQFNKLQSLNKTRFQWANTVEKKPDSGKKSDDASKFCFSAVWLPLPASYHSMKCWFILQYPLHRKASDGRKKNTAWIAFTMY